MPRSSPITILVVDDNVIVRTGLVALLEASDDLEVVAEASNGAEALEATRRHQPNVVLLDVRMPVRDGVSTVEDLSSLTKVIMLTHTEDADIVRTSLRRGASGYLVHGHFSSAELERALRDVVLSDGSPLSPIAASVVLQDMREAPHHPASAPDPASLGLTEREGEIMSAVSRGLSNSSIAEELFLTEKTVKNHLNRIFRKLGVSNRGAAIACWNGTHEPLSTRSHD